MNNLTRCAKSAKHFFFMPMENSKTAHMTINQAVENAQIHAMKSPFGKRWQASCVTVECVWDLPRYVSFSRREPTLSKL